MAEPSSQFLLKNRRVVSVAVHAALFVLAQAGAFALRFEFSLPPEYFQLAQVWIGVNVIIRLMAFAAFGMFSGMWRYTGSKDLIALAKSATLSTLIFATFIVVGGFRSYPRSVFVTDWLLTMMLVGGLRFSVRSVWQIAANIGRRGSAETRRILVVGAGNAGEMLVREMQKAHSGRYEPIGFADDDPTKLRVHIHDVPVVGRIAQVPELVKELRIDELVVAIPSASGKEMRRVLELVKPAAVPIRTMPGIDQLIEGRVTLNQLRSVNIEDLLGRDPVTLDTNAVSSIVNGRVVLVTGAGGSIGSELCRQVARFGPAKLVLLEQAENALFEIHRELANRHPGLALVPCIGDVCDHQRVTAVFAETKPSVVVHAAAHKHVPMMELNPGEALKNNVGGTRLLADVAHDHGVERFVMISTDKAVNPTSVMGATKRVAELYVQAMSARSKTRFVAVRFGNVLGSAGSVIPIFKEQIASGGPVTVTHPEMRRYFMTIPEASQLVLQAAAMGHGGEIFVLDMGEPVRIVDLAKDLITLSGLKPGHDVEIAFTGLRPGEKLFEELSTADEKAEKTRHPKIYIGKLQPQSWDEVCRHIDALLALPDTAGLAEIIERLRTVVPELQRPERLGPTAEVIPLRQRGA